MPWLKAGDNAATHPVVLRAGAQGADVNELFGFVMRCALQSAGHTTDYVVDQGTARLLGEGNHDRLCRAAVKAGYFLPIRHEGAKAWRLIEDADFIHMRLRAELDWERQQKADAANPAITGPVRLRDGDGCRYCGAIVNWGARVGNRRGTYDHRPAGAPATVETLVIACGACNAARRDDPHADDRYPLKPVPTKPYYSTKSVGFLARQGFSVTASDDAFERPGSQPDNATSATPQPAGQRASDPTDGGIPRLVDDADLQIQQLEVPTDRGGSGRDGLGHVSSSDPPPTRRRRRSSRGRPRYA